ncbi:MAG: glycosyltransferase [Pyrinomonadaceae bacterium]
MDQGFRENLTALFEQSYPDFELIFVIDNESDPALKVIEEVRHRVRANVSARVVIAGPARSCGQKVHNLIHAVSEAGPESAVFMFVDSDARPHRAWIGDLVAPLADARVGAATRLSLVHARKRKTRLHCARRVERLNRFSSGAKCAQELLLGRFHGHSPGYF